MSLPPGFKTLKVSRMSRGKLGHQKCVSTAVTRSNMPSGNGNSDTEPCRISTRPSSIHCAFVLCCGHARVGIIDAVDLPPCGDRRQLTDRPAAAATYIEDRAVVLYRDVL